MNLHNWALIVSSLIGLFIPLASSLVVRLHWPAEIGGYFTILFSAITGLVAQWVAADNWTLHDLQGAAVTAGLTLLAAFQTRARVWIGSKIDSKLLAVGSKKAA